MRLHTIGAFLFGLVGSLIFTPPVLFLYGLALQDDQIWLVPLIVFSIVWWWFWTVLGARFNFYTDHAWPYSAGSAIGFLLVLYFGLPAILSFVGVQLG